MDLRSWLAICWAVLALAEDGLTDTSAVLEHLTVAMVARVVDANILDIRALANTSKGADAKYEALI